MRERKEVVTYSETSQNIPEAEESYEDISGESIYGPRLDPGISRRGNTSAIREYVSLASSSRLPQFCNHRKGINGEK
jgi:hypothetical protein